MSDSALESIENCAVTTLQTVIGLATTVISVPFAEIFQVDEAEEIVRFAGVPPPGYPGGTVSLNDREIRVISTRQQNQSSNITYGVPVYIALWQTSDGSITGEARHKALVLMDAALRKLTVAVPLDMPDGIAPYMFEPEGIDSFPIDASTHVMLIKLWSKFQFQT